MMEEDGRGKKRVLKDVMWIVIMEEDGRGKKKGRLEMRCILNINTNSNPLMVVARIEMRGGNNSSNFGSHVRTNFDARR